MTELRNHAACCVLVTICGCVEVPDAPADFAAAGTGAAADAQLASDGGIWTRPPEGEPYLGPECDSAGAAGAFAPQPGDGAAGLPADGDEPGPDLVGSAGAAGGEPGAAAGRPASAGALVIAELMSNPEAVRDDAGEWFELYNAAGQTYDLGGCEIDDGSAAPRKLAGPLRIEPGASVVVARSAEAGFVPDYTLSFSLGNAADVLALICDGVVIDRVAYGAGFPLSPGASLSLDPAALDAAANDAPEAWCAAVIAYGADLGTPGEPNPSCAEADAGSE